MNMNRSIYLFLGFIFCFSSLLGACNRTRADPSASTTQSSAVKPPAPAVKRIVFVGKEHACDCTRKAINESFATLQKTLGPASNLTIERIQIDTHVEEVKQLQQQKAIFTLPAIYFLDEKNGILEQLQGEVTTAEINRVLGKS